MCGGLQMLLERIHAFPLFDHRDDVAARRTLQRQTGGHVNCRPIFKAALLGAHQRHELAKLREERFAFAVVERNRGDDVDHSRRKLRMRSVSRSESRQLAARDVEAIPINYATGMDMSSAAFRRPRLRRGLIDRDGVAAYVSRQEFGNDARRFHAGQSLVQPLVAKAEALMVEAEQL